MLRGASLMISGSIGRRYAKALFSLAVDQNRVEPWSDSLRALKAAVDGSTELRDVLQNPVYSKDQRRAVVAKIADALKLDAEPASLLFLLGDRNRLSHVSAIADHLGELADAKLGRDRHPGDRARRARRRRGHRRGRGRADRQRRLRRLAAHPARAAQDFAEAVAPFSPATHFGDRRDGNPRRRD